MIKKTFPTNLSQENIPFPKEILSLYPSIPPKIYVFNNNFAVQKKQS